MFPAEERGGSLLCAVCAARGVRSRASGVKLIRPQFGSLGERRVLVKHRCLTPTSPEPPKMPRLMRSHGPVLALRTIDVVVRVVGKLHAALASNFPIFQHVAKIPYAAPLLVRDAVCGSNARRSRMVSSSLWFGRIALVYERLVRVGGVGFAFDRIRHSLLEDVGFGRSFA